MLVVVGLGNPGTEYEGTRHNAGFMVVDLLSGRWRKPFKPGKGDYLAVRGSVGGRDLALVKPLTYMNNSGAAVLDALRQFDAEAENLLVVVDDFALPLGTIRMRPGGSDGGHNGLYSVISDLRREDFPRLRCGIGRTDQKPTGDMAEFVLSPFREDELETARQMIARAADAVTEFVTGSITGAMNRFNT